MQYLEMKKDYDFNYLWDQSLLQVFLISTIVIMTDIRLRK